MTHLDHRTRNLAIISLIGFLLLLTLGGIHALNLSEDEAYYWYWSEQPDLSYLDHPPMIAWVIAAGTAVLGDTVSGVRAPAFVLFLFILFFVYRTVRTLFPAQGSSMAWETVLLLNVTLLFPAIGTIITVDTPLLFAWSASLYFTAMALTDGRGAWWLAAGASVGVGLLSKYTMVLFPACVFGFLLVSPAHRFWLSRREPYLGAVLALAIFSPVIIWNWQHDWISFTFQLNQGFAQVSQPRASRLLEYLALQFGIMSPTIFVAFLVYSVFALRIVIRERNTAFLFLLVMSWPIILFFAVTTWFGERAEGNWPAPGYLAGIILTWIVFRMVFSTQRGHRWFMGTCIIVALVLNVLVRAHLAWPFLPVPAEADPLRKFASWPALGERVAEIARSTPTEKGYFLVADGGPKVAEIVFYSGARFRGVDFARPERYLFLGDVDSDFLGRDAIIVANTRLDAETYYSPYFEGVTRLEDFTYSYRGESFDEYRAQVLLGRGFKGNWREHNPLP
ncbi:MAG: glycosyltransferase family 39 protein [Pseudomonadota bacterium]|nr:glycosyltransferase family 39 protein [Pseudomonadota bacterium]